MQYVLVTMRIQAQQKWGQWFENPAVPPTAQQSVQRLQSYAWYDDDSHELPLLVLAYTLTQQV